MVSKFESISSAVETSCVNSLRVKILELVIAETATSFETRDDKRRKKRGRGLGSDSGIYLRLYT